MSALRHAAVERGVVVEAAHLRYGKAETGTDALRGVSLTAHAGEVLMIRGPSGSGKTTLLQLMGAMKTPDQGSVRICGESTAGARASGLRDLRLRRIGFVFQFFNLFPTLTAWENVAVPLDLIGADRRSAEGRARHLLDEMGLSDRAEYKPGQMSGGQRQRVAVARALVAWALAHDRDVILADEPTAALDGASGGAVLAVLRRLANEEGRAVVIVSHDQRLLDKVDRHVTVEDGLVVDDVPHGPRDRRPDGARSLR